jgi:hypothetical protein
MEQQPTSLLQRRARHTTVRGLPDSCPACGSANGADAAVIRVCARPNRARFPTLSSKELAQAIGRSDSAGLTDRQAVHGALAKTQNATWRAKSAGH